jgi:NAD(P)H-hydrate repair Nnr-like enzyme with NAD(P)H-hydrate dehydratase domain
LPSLPPGSVLTPHPKEFERLFGESKDDFERIEKALNNAKLLNCLIVLKVIIHLLLVQMGKDILIIQVMPGWLLQVVVMFSLE